MVMKGQFDLASFLDTSGKCCGNYCFVLFGGLGKYLTRFFPPAYSGNQTCKCFILFIYPSMRFITTGDSTQLHECKAGRIV